MFLIRPSNRIARRIAAAVPAIVVLGLSACGDRGPVGASGRLEADRVVVGSETSGRVVELVAREGDRVEEADVLARVDCRDAEAQHEVAAARVRAASARLALLDAGARDEEIAAATARLRAAEARESLARAGATSDQIAQIDAAMAGIDARLTLARTELQRAEALLGAGGSTQARIDRARTERDALEAERARLAAQRDEARHGGRSQERTIAARQVDEAQAALDALVAGARDPERDVARADLDGAAAALAGAALSVERCVVRSPVAGRLDVVAVDRGELLHPGAPVAVVVPDGALHLVTWAPQEWLASVRVGSTLDAEVDGLGTRLEAVVTTIAEDAEFTGTNVQTPTDRALLVYRVEATLSGAPDPGVRPGMTLTVMPPGGEHE